ncbi:hypothetical protein AB1Y20_009746 [Prymnesium parvum]|uniref:Uncharacterized protein n=1 Tax=Prymnesium parvum TaxID=97485 RepID=A0AB34K4U0_PRYPA|mmetsp:Transcript_9013/g.18789  ORF Transcript_9013/g.18789 Transcript_9013/m.18789 type:complete len:241 (-) Transcript_9013:589-1311(-)
MTSTGMSRNDQMRRWQKIRKLPENDKCAECHAPDTSWAVLDYGILICINCAGAHRAMGTHISKVRSPDLDQFTDDEFTWIEHQGNAKSNALYESAIPRRMRRPAPESPDCIRRRWLREKYDNQLFTAGSEHTEGHPHETACGWLQKRGSFMKTWKRRFFRVQNGAVLAYFSSETCDEKTRRGTYALKAATLELDQNDPLILKLVGKETKGNLLVARAETSEQAEEWAWCFFQCTYAASLG